jgi:hypothetical protein
MNGTLSVFVVAEELLYEKICHEYSCVCYQELIGDVQDLAINEL